MTYFVKKYYQLIHLRKWNKKLSVKHVRWSWEAYFLKIVNFTVNVKTLDVQP